MVFTFRLKYLYIVISAVTLPCTYFFGLINEDLNSQIIKNI